VIAQWLEVADHEKSTRERYDQLIRLYVEPTLGTMQAGQVDAELLERFYARLTNCRQLAAADGAAVTNASLWPPTPCGRFTSFCGHHSIVRSAGTILE